MNWTQTRPTEPGWYGIAQGPFNDEDEFYVTEVEERTCWHELDATEKDLTRIEHGSRLHAGCHWLDSGFFDGAWWCGPIELPPIPLELLAPTTEKT